MMLVTKKNTVMGIFKGITVSVTSKARHLVESKKIKLDEAKTKSTVASEHAVLVFLGVHVSRPQPFSLGFTL